jgi:hypothetical protein
MSDWKDFLVGKTLTSIEEITGTKGEEYIRFDFGDTYYEFLSHFAPSEHKLFIAEEALNRIARLEDSPGDIAADALFDLKKFDTKESR